MVGLKTHDQIGQQPNTYSSRETDMTSQAQAVFNKSTTSTVRANAIAAAGHGFNSSTYKFPDGSELFVNAYGITYVNNPTPMAEDRKP